jgi:hypothetical protein
MKSSLALLFLLLFAASAQAQHTHSFSSGSSINPGGGYGGGYSGGWDGYGAGGYGYGSGGSQHHGGLQYEPPREFSSGYVTNDGPYIPSTFMNYDDALALGKQQLAAAAAVSAQADTGPSLGDVARACRAAKSSTQRPPTLALQDNTGRRRQLPATLREAQTARHNFFEALAKSQSSLPRMRRLAVRAYPGQFRHLDSKKSSKPQLLQKLEARGGMRRPMFPQQTKKHSAS